MSCVGSAFTAVCNGRWLKQLCSYYYALVVNIRTARTCITPWHTTTKLAPSKVTKGSTRLTEIQAMFHTGEPTTSGALLELVSSGCSNPLFCGPLKNSLSERDSSLS